MEPVSIGVLSLVALTLFLMSGVRIAFATAMCRFEMVRQKLTSARQLPVPPSARHRL